MTTERTFSLTRKLSTLGALAVLIIATGAGCGGETTTTPTPVTNTSNATATMSGYKLHTSSKGYSIEYPESWKKQEGFAGTDIMFNAPVKNNFSANLNVVASNADGNSGTLKEIKESLPNYYKQLFNDVKIASTEEVTVGSEPAIRIIYTATQGQIKGSFIQYFIIKNNKNYVITVTRSQSDAAASESEFSNMIKTFKITN